MGLRERDVRRGAAPTTAKSGLSLVELMIAFLIILVVALYIFSLFASGQKHWLRAQQYSVSSFLVHQKMQEALLTPLAELPNGKVSCDPPFQDFTYQIDAHPYEGRSIYQVDVEVTSRIGTSARATTLVGDNHNFSGLVTDQFTNIQTFVNGARLTSFDGAGRSDSAVAPDGRKFGGLAGWPGSNLLWSAAGNFGPMKFLESGASAGWVGPVGLDVGALGKGLAPPNFVGVAGDNHGSTQLVADSVNRCVWLMNDPVTTIEALRPAQVPLGQPAGVACDPYVSVAWVSDQENQCIRKLFLQPAPAYPAADLDGPAASGTNVFWHNREFRPSTLVGFGNPQGIAMDPYAWAVYVVDRSRLYRYIDSLDEWTVLGTFPDPQIQEGVSGLAMDPYNNLLYLNTLSGNLYELKIPNQAPPGSNTTLVLTAH